MRHIGKELIFVFGAERQLFGFFFQILLRLFNFAIFALDLVVLVFLQACFVFQFFVRLAKFFLLSAQQVFRGLQRTRLLFEAAIRFGEFGLLLLERFRKRLRFLKQCFSTHIRANRVQNDSDTFGQLVKEGQVNIAETVERSEFDNGGHLSFKNHR